MLAEATSTLRVFTVLLCLVNLIVHCVNGDYECAETNALLVLPNGQTAQTYPNASRTCMEMGGLLPSHTSLKCVKAYLKKDQTIPYSWLRGVIGGEAYASDGWTYHLTLHPRPFYCSLPIMECKGNRTTLFVPPHAPKRNRSSAAALCKSLGGQLPASTQCLRNILIALQSPTNTWTSQPGVIEYNTRRPEVFERTTRVVPDNPPSTIASFLCQRHALCYETTGDGFQMVLPGNLLVCQPGYSRLAPSYSIGIKSCINRNPNWLGICHPWQQCTQSEGYIAAPSELLLDNSNATYSNAQATCSVLGGRLPSAVESSCAKKYLTGILERFGPTHVSDVWIQSNSAEQSSGTKNVLCFFSQQR
eukprot:scpid68413/ scgid34356/ 